MAYFGLGIADDDVGFRIVLRSKIMNCERGSQVARSLCELADGSSESQACLRHSTKNVNASGCQCAWHIQ